MPDHAYICFVRCAPPGGTFAPCPARALDNCAKFFSFCLLLLLFFLTSYISYFRLSLTMFWLSFFVVIVVVAVVIFGVDELIAAM